MIAGLVHELRQPLGAIGNLVAGGLRLLATPDVAPGRLEEPLHRIKAEAYRMDGILHNLPKLLLGGARLNCERTNINILIREAARLATHAAGVDADAIAFKLAKELPALRLDVASVRQALLNVMRNGLDASRRPRGETCLRVASLVTREHHVRVSVADSGSGCAASRLKRLGEPYYTTKSDGTGLGMWLVRSIVAAHGGAVTVRRRTQGGLSVQLTFRAIDDD